MLELREDTASQVILLGPFIDDTDGKTPKTGLSIANTDIKLNKHGGTTLVNKNSVGATEISGGYYYCTLDATDTDTAGRLFLSVKVAGALVVFHEFMVRPTQLYDSMVLGTDKIQVDLTEVNGAAQTATLDTIKAETVLIVEDTGTTLPATLATAQADLDLISGNITLSGTATGGSTTTIVLTGGVATNNYYNGQIVTITGGTGVGQSRTILAYAAAGTVATVTRDWAVAPSSDSVFIVQSDDVPTILEAGLAQAGGVATITLDATASAITDTYKNNHIMITAGTGAGQTRLIGAYDGSTKIATIVPNWTTNPAAGSVYQVLPAARVDVAGWAGSLVTLSANNRPDVNVAEISDDEAAANNLELDYDGTGLVRANSTIGTCTTLTGHTPQTGDNYARIGAPAGASVSVDIAAIKTEADNIALTDAGAGVAGSVIEEVENRATPAEVNTQVEDVLKTDTLTMPGQVAPTNTPTFENAIAWLYKAFKNKKTQTATSWELRDDGDTQTDAKATVSDSAGTATKTQITAGP